MTPRVQPLSYRHRYWFFYLLLGIFVSSLPFLFLYASGYRFEFGKSGLISTGGLYIAAERTGAQIYINDELVRETRVFRRAFYSQGLPEGTHKVHVTKDGYNTWVKELPIYAHLVTEAQVFNLPLVPEVRVITPWRTSGDVAVMTSTSTVNGIAIINNQFLLEPRASITNLTRSTEFDELLNYFEATTTPTQTTSLLERMQTTQNSATTTETIATTTKEWRGVLLYESEGEVFARYIGNENSMPYYYCAESFSPYQPATTTAKSSAKLPNVSNVASASEYDDDLNLKVQTVKDAESCDPVIKIDRNGEVVEYFDFFPNSTDLVVIGSESGIYVVEIDDRAWQNRQPLLKVAGMKVRVVNGNIYAYDGEYIYQLEIGQTWF